MAQRFFTSDFHFAMPDILKYANRPFVDVHEMNEYLIRMCNQTANENDTIIHIGDLYTFNSDNLKKVKLNELTSRIDAQFVNIRGNHDLNNKVKSLCDSMQTHLGKTFPDVICGHYPSYDRRASSYMKPGWITLCGHVHEKWKHCLDVTNKVLNINVGIDVWNYKIVSEDMLVRYIMSLLSMPMDKINKVKVQEGKVIHE